MNKVKLKKQAALLIPVCMLLGSCKSSREDMLTHKWYGVALDNPQMEQMLTEQAIFIDTFGQGGTPEQNLKNYGFTNVDSARASLHEQMEVFKSSQQQSVKNTTFDFRKDGVAVMNFGGQIDSANWYFDDEGL